MIKFFRKIRQKLLSDNKFSKYLIYAIGEILLVVFGILIALQINKWNDNEKKKVQKISYIERFISDIKKDTETAVATNNAIKKKQANIEKLVHLLNTDQLNVNLTESIEEYFKIGWVIPSFEPTSNTYTNMTQSGNFDLMGQNNLSEKIVEYYVNIENILKNAQLNEQWLLPSDSKLVDQTSALEIDYATRILFKDKDKSQAINNLIENKEMLERNAAIHYWLNRSLSNGMESLIQDSKNLIELLEKELNK